MTSDAKIGLLLGLAFIFIIAFVINGLPNFHKISDDNELATNMTSIEDNSLGIGSKERKVQANIDWKDVVERQPFDKVQSPLEDQQEIRSVTPLPNSTLVLEKPDDFIETQSKKAMVLPLPVEIKNTEKKKPKHARETWPKTYVVKQGDNLATIAVKSYGPEQGNRRVNVSRIFGANRKQLKSADEIYVGQKLIIPAPSGLKTEENKKNGIFSSSLFEKVKSIGSKHLSLDNRSAEQSRLYVVRDGDSLWKIAAEQLGNGSRYKEVAKLNTDILNDEDNLLVGLRLKIPAR